MADNIPRMEANNVILTYKGEKLEVVFAYVYFGVLFSAPCLILTPVIEDTLRKGYLVLTTLENICFKLQCQDIRLNVLLFRSLVRPTLLYGCDVRDPYL